jgi:hypothetical protein
MTIGIVSEQGNACTYQSVKSIQKNNLDGQPTGRLLCQRRRQSIAVIGKEEPVRTEEGVVEKGERPHHQNDDLIFVIGKVGGRVSKLGPAIFVLKNSKVDAGSLLTDIERKGRLPNLARS